MKRRLILGPGASRKSTLAARSGEITGLPIIELDKLFCRPGLLPAPQDQWVELQQKLVDEYQWIIDGDLGPYDAVEVRLRAADTMITLVCSLRLVRHATRARTRRFLVAAAGSSHGVY